MQVHRLRDLVRIRLNRQEITHSKEFWNSKVDHYEGISRGMWPNDSLNELFEVEQRRQLEKPLPSVVGLDVLEIGCGVGRFSRYFAEKGARSVLGVDFADKAVEAARAETCDSRVRYEQASLFEIEYSQEFDLVFVCGALTVACKTESQLADALGRIRRALRPNGRFVSFEPLHRGFLSRVLSLTPQEFVDCASRTGLAVDHRSCVHFWPTRLLLSYFNLPSSVTWLGAKAGELALSVFDHQRLGDYSLVSARAVW